MDESKKILVAVSWNPACKKLIRTAKAKLKNGDLGFCVFVETDQSSSLTDSQKESLSKNLKYAESLGFEVFTVQSDYPHKGIVSFTQEKEVDSITIGLTRKHFLSGSNYNKIIKELPDVEVNVAKLPKIGNNFNFRLPNLSLFSVLISISIIVIANVINYLAFYTFEILTHTTFKVSIIYTISIVIIALNFGYINALISSILSALFLNYYFTNPAYSFQIDDAEDFTGLIFFIFLSILISAISSYSRSRFKKADRANIINQHILKLSNRVVGLSKVASIQKALKEEIEKVLDCDAEIILSKDDNLMLGKNNLSDDDIVNLNLCFNELREVKTDKKIFFPINTRESNIGVIILSEFNSKTDINFNRLIKSLSSLSANALERAILSKELDDAETLKEKEQLRADLLSSVSHDLKTPLASIIGSLTAMHHMKGSLDEDAIETLRFTAVEEAERLNQFITNILEMTKIESGGIKLKKELYDFDEIAEEVLVRLKNKTSNHTVRHIKNTSNIKVNVDKLLLSQILQNLIDNAVKYSEKNTNIKIESFEDEDKFIIQISDEGFGIPDDMKEKIFDKFERIKLTDKKIAGTGLGLAICKSMTEVMGGRIKIKDNTESSTGSGTIFQIIF